MIMSVYSCEVLRLTARERRSGGHFDKTRSPYSFGVIKFIGVRVISLPSAAFGEKALMCPSTAVRHLTKHTHCFRQGKTMLLSYF